MGTSAADYSKRVRPATAEYARADGRKGNDVRSLKCEMALLERADGSAKYDSGDRTQVLVAVYGPVEVRQRDELLDKATIQAIFRPLVGVTSPSEKTFEAAVRESASHVIAANLHPRTLVQIVAQVVSDDGSTLSAAINATTLALIDAGVYMTEIVAALTCAVTEDGTLLLDPTAKEIKAARSVHTFGFLHGPEPEIVLSESTGFYNELEYMSACELCQRGSEKLFRFMRRAVNRRVNKAEGQGQDAEVIQVDSDAGTD